MNAIELLEKVRWHVTSLLVDNEDIDNAILEIKEKDKEFEEFKNRSCNNCKYSEHTKEVNVLECNNDIFVDYIAIDVYSDFCCNKWEQR